MNFNINIFELGKILKTIEANYELEVLIKLNLSGGWMTLTGKAFVHKYPHETSSSCSGNKDNIIHLKVKNDDNSVILKITGAKDKKFNIDISPSRYKEISKNGLSIDMIKINENECKLRIDDNIIFTIKSTMDNIKKILEL